MKPGLGLGKGLGALISSSAQTVVDPRTLPTDDGSLVGITALIDISKVRPNPFQPRQDFDPQALADLANSIKEKGVIQPITVRRAENGYELIAGERRVRASIEAGMTRIPAYILDITTDADMLEIALIENVQRENLNPIEVALGYQRLIDQCNLTQEDVAEKVGKDRSTVTNFLRLLKLPREIQESLRTKKITMGHARAMLALTESGTQNDVLKEVLDKELSVRSTEALVKNVELGRVSSVLKPGESAPQRYESQPKKFEPSQTMSPEIASTISEIESRLRTVFGTQVRVRTKNSNAGSIEIDFYSIDELEGLLQKFSIIERSEM